MIQSPCVRVCQLDPDTGFCRGCYRTVDEIAGWPEMSDRDKEECLNILDERKERTSEP